MEIENLSKFAEYCQSRADDKDLPQQMHFANRLANATEARCQQYGNQISRVAGYIDDSFRDLTKEAGIDGATLKTSEEVLSRFWKYKEEFGEWFQSKVIIVKN